MTSREDVYRAIDTERDYQDKLPAYRTDKSEKTVGDYIVLIQAYSHALVEAWTYNPGNLDALEVMRKIAGIAVHCMEDHGAPQR